MHSSALLCILLYSYILFHTHIYPIILPYTLLYSYILYYTHIYYIYSIILPYTLLESYILYYTFPIHPFTMLCPMLYYSPHHSTLFPFILLSHILSYSPLYSILPLYSPEVPCSSKICYTPLFSCILHSTTLSLSYTLLFSPFW